MSDTPRFSIIVPAYNVADYLEECLRSVAAQSGRDWECLVVDDGSTDGATGPLADRLAAELPGYLLENGYTHAEFLPLAEHPFDGSWGYQITGFYAPTSRYGTPEGLCRLIDACHNAGIGVILDFVPVHFAVDDYGLRRFDGTALYEYPAGDVGDRKSVV